LIYGRNFSRAIEFIVSGRVIEIGRARESRMMETHIVLAWLCR